MTLPDEELAQEEIGVGAPRAAGAEAITSGPARMTTPADRPSVNPIDAVINGRGQSGETQATATDRPSGSIAPERDRASGDRLDAVC